MKAALLGLLILTGSFLPGERKKIKLFLAGDSTMSIKETRYYPETGWGMPFEHFWDSSVTVVNRAKNGRSTKTFIQEGLWKSIQTQASEGDFVFIQFGHNDEAKDKGERYATPDTFKMNLIRFIKEARDLKATPVLLTPVSRRKFDQEGRAMETHLEYSALVREVAHQQQALIIDLDEKSRVLYQQFGPENSKWLFLQLQPGEHPNYPEGRNDNTHFSELGARLVAQLVLKELRALSPELCTHLKSPQRK